MLDSFVRQKYLVSRISLSDRYAASLKEVVAMYGNYLGRPTKFADLDEFSISAFLSSLAGQRSASTINSYRRRLLTIWEYALLLKRVRRVPNRKLIRTLPEELEPPTAWNQKQIADLMIMAAKQPGCVGSVQACDWWLSLLISIYWTSCRIGSMLAIPTTAYDGKGMLIRRQKNHRPQWYPLPASCRALIEKTKPDNRKLLWYHPWHPRTVWTKARQIIESAGLPAPKTGRQLFHRLRRTTITLCASVDPAIAQRTAGHQSYATTLKHYIDPRIVSERSAADILPDPLAEQPIYKIPTLKFRIYG